MSRVHVVIPFAQVSVDQNPNSRSKTDEQQQAAYARAAAVTLASLRRWNPELELDWVSNAPVHPLLQPVLERVGATHSTPDFRHRPPAGFMETFAGCLYLLDVMAGYDDAPALYLDPDVVCVAPLDELVAAGRDRVGALPFHYPRDEKVNGVDTNLAARLTPELAPGRMFTNFVGGEALWVPAGHGKALREELERAWEQSLAQHARGEAHYSTEEHFLSHALSGADSMSLAPFVSRVWTTSRYRTVNGREGSLALWHLPSEKDTGFPKAYEAVMDNASWFWKADREGFVEAAARTFSLRHRTPRKFLRDLAGHAVNVVTRRRI